MSNPNKRQQDIRALIDLCDLTEQLHQIDKEDPSLKENPTLLSLTRAELFQKETFNKRTLLHALAKVGLAPQIAHLLHDPDFLRPCSHSTGDAPGRIIHLVAQHPFPADKFPYHLLDDKLLPEVAKTSDSPNSKLCTILGLLALTAASPSHNKPENKDNLPIFSVDPKLLTEYRLFEQDGRGFSTLGYLLRCRPHGHTLLAATQVLETARPTRLFEKNILNRSHLEDILSQNGAQLVPPRRFTDHLDQAISIAKTCRMNLQIDIDLPPDDARRHHTIENAKIALHGLHTWTAELAQTKLGLHTPSHQK